MSKSGMTKRQQEHPRERVSQAEGKRKLVSGSRQTCFVLQTMVRIGLCMERNSEEQGRTRDMRSSHSHGGYFNASNILS